MAARFFRTLPVLCLFMCGTLPAQTQLFTHYGTDKGLSQTSVFLIYQDKRGFMWFGTADGLNRYDGNEFKVYRHQDSSRARNSNFFGRKAVEDQDGNIYLSGRTGLSKYDFRNDQLSYLFPDRFTGMIEVLMLDGHVLWFTDCIGKLYTYHLLTGELKAIPLADAPHAPPNFRIVRMDDRGCVWYNRLQGVGCYDTRTGRFSVHLDGFLKNRPMAVFQDIAYQGSKAILNFYSFLLEYDPGTGAYRMLGEREEKASYLQLLTAPDGSVYVATVNRGLNILKADGTLLALTRKRQPEEGPASNIITALYIDRSRNLWLGCDGYGISKTPAGNARFNLFRFEDHDKDGFSSNFTKAIYASGNETWIGCHERGLQVIDRQTGRYRTILEKRPGANTVACFLPVDQQTLMIGSGAGVSCIDRNTMKITYPEARHPMVALPGQNMVMSFVRLKNKRIYAASRQGVLYVEQSGNAFTTLKQVKGIPPAFLAACCQTPDGSVWFSSIEYGYVYRCIETGPGKLELKDTLFWGMNVRSFYPDTAAGILWMASEKGLLRYELASGRHQLITTASGFSNNYLYSVLPGSSRHELWMSSNKGLIRYNTRTGEVNNFFGNDGLQSNEFNTGSYFRSDDAELFFGGVNGFNYFKPSGIGLNPTVPDVKLTGINVNDEEADWLGNAAAIEELHLPYSSNTLSFDFAALEFTNESKNLYQYKLQGLDDGWVNSGSRHFARYSLLQPGNYLFMVRASNNDGAWSPEAGLVRIRIDVPWWLSWWFLMLAALSLLAILFFIIRTLATRKLKARLRELEKQEAVNKERSRISKDMHDDLGSGLTKIAIMSELLKKQLAEHSNSQVEKISSTAGDLIDNMSHIIWAMNPENDKLENLLSYLREYALDFFHDTPVRCELDFEEHVPDSAISQQRRRNIFLVYKESLNNILKHSGAAQVHIKTSLDGNTLQIRISDNGKGFDTEHARRSGNGLRNMHKRMQDAGGSYEIRSEKGNGTLAFIRVSPADAT